MSHTTCVVNAWKILKGLWKMIVNINNSTYEMNSKQYKVVLDTASNAVTYGIYAVEKNKVAIMLREEYKSKEELKQAVGNYTAKGFTVYWNEKNEVENYN